MEQGNEDSRLVILPPMSSLDPSLVVQCLQASVSPSSSAEDREKARSILEDAEREPGFLGVLFGIYENYSGDDVKFLSITLAKNAAQRTRIREKQEKELLKSQLIHFLKKEGGEVSFLPEVVLFLRKFLRTEFPQEWPEFNQWLAFSLENVFQKFKNVEAFASEKDKKHLLLVVSCLHGALKEQQSKRLLPAKRQFFQIAPQILEKVIPLWGELNKVASSISAGDVFWKISRYLDGSILFLSNFGAPHLHDSPFAPDLLRGIFEKLQLLLHRLFSEKVEEWPQKNVKNIAKWLSLTVRDHPLSLSFLGVDQMLKVAVEVISLAGEARLEKKADVLEALPPHVSKFFFKILHYSLNSASFRKGKEPHLAFLKNVDPSNQEEIQKLEKKMELADKCHFQFSSWFSSISVPALCDRLLQSGLLLSEEEVEEWLEEPEEAVSGPLGGSELRQATEGCLLTLSQAPYEEAVRDHIRRRLEESLSGGLDLPTPQHALKLDALLAWFILFYPSLRKPGGVKGDQLLSLLTPLFDFSRLKGVGILLSFRALCLVKTWTEDIPSSSLPQVLSLLSSALKEGPFPCKLGAILAVKSITEQHKEASALEEQAAPLADLCLHFLPSVQAPDVQWRLLSLVTLLFSISSSSGGGRETGGVLKLGELWAQSGDKELIKFALLDCFKALLSRCSLRLPSPLLLSPSLASTVVKVVNDCLLPLLEPAGLDMGLGEPVSPIRVPRRPRSAAGEEGTWQAALRDQGEVIGTLGEAGLQLLVCLLRVLPSSPPQEGGVDCQEILQTPLLMGILTYFTQVEPEDVHEVVLDVIAEFLSLYLNPSLSSTPIPPASSPVPSSPPLLFLLSKLIKSQLERAPGGQGSAGQIRIAAERRQEKCLHLIHLLLLFPPSPPLLQSLHPVLQPLLHLWIQTFPVNLSRVNGGVEVLSQGAERGRGSPAPPLPSDMFPLPAHSTLHLLNCLASRHPEMLREILGTVDMAGRAVELLISASSTFFRPPSSQLSLLGGACQLMDREGMRGNQDLWRKMLKAYSSSLSKLESAPTSPTSKAGHFLQSLASLRTSSKLPPPVRMNRTLQSSPFSLDFLRQNQKSGGEFFSDIEVCQYSVRVPLATLVQHSLKDLNSTLEVFMEATNAPEAVQAALRSWA